MSYNGQVADRAAPFRSQVAEVIRVSTGNRAKAEKPVTDDATFRLAFEAVPHPYLPSSPTLRIVGVNDPYLLVTVTNRPVCSDPTWSTHSRTIPIIRVPTESPSCGYYSPAFLRAARPTSFRCSNTTSRVRWRMGRVLVETNQHSGFGLTGASDAYSSAYRGRDGATS